MRPPGSTHGSSRATTKTTGTLLSRSRRPGKRSVRKLRPAVPRTGTGSGRPTKHGDSAQAEPGEGRGLTRTGRADPERSTPPLHSRLPDGPARLGPVQPKAG